jgi:hypothetical protein
MKALAIPFSSFLIALAISASGNALAQQTASDTTRRSLPRSLKADGTRWRPASWQKASTPNVKDAANSEVHDHEPSIRS